MDKKERPTRFKMPEEYYVFNDPKKKSIVMVILWIFSGICVAAKLVAGLVPNPEMIAMYVVIPYIAGFITLGTFIWALMVITIKKDNLSFEASGTFKGLSIRAIVTAALGGFTSIGAICAFGIAGDMSPQGLMLALIPEAVVCALMVVSFFLLKPISLEKRYK